LRGKRASETSGSTRFSVTKHYVRLSGFSFLEGARASSFCMMRALQQQFDTQNSLNPSAIEG
jgi:hypothetical protein